MKKKPWIIVESELDAILLHQELSDIFRVFAIGNASSRPDRSTHEYIKDFPGLLCLDDDAAGHAEQEWWHNQYKYVYTYYSEFGKDPGDSYEVGVDIRAWGLNGLKLIPDVILKATQIQAQPSQKNIKTKAKELISKAYFDTNQTEQICQPAKPRRKPIPTPHGACLHGLLCQSYRDGVCLVHKQPVSDYFIYAKKCPKDKWSVWYHPSGSYSQIILGVGLKDRWADDGKKR